MFISRAIKDPFARLFCILGFEFLEPRVSSSVLLFIKKKAKLVDDLFYVAILHKSKAMNWKNNIVMIREFPLKREFSFFDFSDEAEVVTSAQPGMGKSHYIRRKSASRVLARPTNQQNIRLRLSGEITHHKLKLLSANLALLSQSEDMGLHVSICNFKNSPENCFLISQFVFKLVYFRLVE